MRFLKIRFRRFREGKTALDLRDGMPMKRAGTRISPDRGVTSRITAIPIFCGATLEAMSMDPKLYEIEETNEYKLT